MVQPNPPILKTLPVKPSADFCYPSGLFDEAATDFDWTCAVVRPRWEKKFSRWLMSRQMAHFLPLTNRRTTSYRKVRYSRVPLFPGYLFVRGVHSRKSFSATDCVVRIILPESEAARRRLAYDLYGVHALLSSGGPVVTCHEWTPGQCVRILAGALTGSIGEFIREDTHGQFIIRIDMLGVGASVNLPADTPIEPV